MCEGRSAHPSELGRFSAGQLPRAPVACGPQGGLGSWAQLVLPDVGHNEDTPSERDSAPTTLARRPGMNCRTAGLSSPRPERLQGSPGELVSKAWGPHRLGLSFRWCRLPAGARIWSKCHWGASGLMCNTWVLAGLPSRGALRGSPVKRLAWGPAQRLRVWVAATALALLAGRLNAEDGP